MIFIFLRFRFSVYLYGLPTPATQYFRNIRIIVCVWLAQKPKSIQNVCHVSLPVIFCNISICDTIIQRLLLENIIIFFFCRQTDNARISLHRHCLPRFGRCCSLISKFECHTSHTSYILYFIRLNETDLILYYEL